MIGLYGGIGWLLCFCLFLIICTPMSTILFLYKMGMLDKLEDLYTIVILLLLLFFLAYLTGLFIKFFLMSDGLYWLLGYNVFLIIFYKYLKREKL
jgi:hypothetical protein